MIHLTPAGDPGYDAEAFHPDGRRLRLFGGGGGGKGSPKPPKVVTPTAPTPQPTEQDASVTTSRDNERRRRIAAASSTIMTSAQGVTGTAPTAGKTLLGA